MLIPALRFNAKSAQVGEFQSQRNGAYFDTPQHFLGSPPATNNAVIANQGLGHQTGGSCPKYLQTRQIDVDETWIKPG